MSRKIKLPRFHQLIILCLIPLIAGNISIKKTKAQEPEEITLFFPFVSTSEIFYYLSRVDLSRLTSFTSQLVREYGPRHHYRFQAFVNRSCTLGGSVYPENNLVRASKFFSSYMKSLGYSTTEEYVNDGTGAYNVVATKSGIEYPDVFIEIGAHIDTRETTPGASDNAAAVAAVLELATVLQEYPNRYSLRFISFVGEEYHMVNGIKYDLTGSRFHAARIVAAREKIKVGLLMDGIGWSEAYPQLMNCIWDNGSGEGRRVANIYNDVRLGYGLNIHWRLCSPASSGQVADNMAYWERNIPAVLNIGGLPYRDPNYHKCTDDMQTVNLQNAFLTAKQNLAVLWTLDKEPWNYLAQPEHWLEPAILWPGESH
jgi:hypothetical protein